MRASRHLAVACLFLCLVFSLAAAAQTLTTLVNFNGPNGAGPTAPLIQATDGNFYSTTSTGGANNSGTVFQVTSDGTLTTLYSFAGSDGSTPYAGLVQGTDGNFYGTTGSGGASSNGTVFQITPGGALTTLHSFDGSDGSAPYGGLVQATDGDFYGTTSTAGANSGGTVFKITPQGTLTTLHSFGGSGDGAAPHAGLVQATDGNFYGTTRDGGATNNGTVFQITPQGTLTLLHSFNGLGDGSAPYGGLVQATDGNFYGTTSSGGANGYGTVFKITPAGALTTLQSFDYTKYGAGPQATLAQATDGNLYGTTVYGGASQSCLDGCGTVFQITLGGKFTGEGSFSGVDGAAPYAGLVQATDGNLYGTTSAGGTNSDGTVFSLAVGPVPLSVTKVGSGTVTSGDGHIYCGGVCSYSYPNGIQVGLTAVPGPGYTFSGWSGCDNMQGNVCTVKMSRARTATATFDVANVNLTSLVFNPVSVKGGNVSTATLTLGAPAPSGGVGVAMSTDQPLVVHPPSLVIVPGGRTSFSFAVRTSVVRMMTVANVTATAGASQTSGTLTVTTQYGSSLSLR